jgi:hypothetical protein
MRRKRIPFLKEKLIFTGTIYVVLYNVMTKKKRVIKAKNIITNEGDKWYAQRACGETPAYDFIAGGLKLGSGTTAPTKSDTDVETYLSGTYKTVYTGYPRTNDPDPNNTGSGADIITWKFFYDTNEANYAQIYEFAIVDQETNPNAALCRIVPGYGTAKTSNETMTIFINHRTNGV